MNCFIVKIMWRLSIIRKLISILLSRLLRIIPLIFRRWYRIRLNGGKIVWEQKKNLKRGRGNSMNQFHIFTKFYLIWRRSLIIKEYRRNKDCIIVRIGLARYWMLFRNSICNQISDFYSTIIIDINLKNIITHFRLLPNYYEDCFFDRIFKGNIHWGLIFL